MKVTDDVNIAEVVSNEEDGMILIVWETGYKQTFCILMWPNVKSCVPGQRVRAILMGWDSVVGSRNSERTEDRDEYLAKSELLQLCWGQKG